MEVKTVLNSKAHDAVKRSINAPCLIVEFDKRGNKVRHAPSVDCEWSKVLQDEAPRHFHQE